MKCPFCNAKDTRVINSRPSSGGDSIRRRRECEECGNRFTTFEVVERAPFWVIKRNGVRERYDSGKLRSGIEKSCEKRNVTMEQIDRILAAVEGEAFNTAEREVKSEKLGKLVLRELREVDKVAYLRFASVYKSFCDLQDFNQEIRSLMKD